MIGGSRTDIEISDADGAVAAGRDVHIGLTFEEHQTALKEREAELRKDLERAHEGEKAVLQLELSAVGGKLSDVETDYQKTLAELAEIKAKLAQYDNQISGVEKQSAYDALDRGDRSIADALFAALEKKAQARADDALEEAAEMAFQQGQIAEQDIRWYDAAEHYARAAGTVPNFKYLRQHWDFLWKLGRADRAIVVAKDLRKAAESEFGRESEEFGGALSCHALSVNMTGDFSTAEPIYRETVELAKKTIGEGHPNYAISLNNLAVLLKDMGRLDEAEPLFRQAIEIGNATIGEGHPDYAIHLNNLAELLRAMGPLGEAEPLYRQAIEIDKATIGEGHPSYATHLNNLALLLQAMGRYEEAEPLFRQAIEIGKATIGERHPDYATRLNNLALLLQAMGKPEDARPLIAQSLAIFQKALGEDNPNTKTVAGNVAIFLHEHFPDDPALAELEATFGPEIGKG